MANNELSGPAVLTALARWLSKCRKRRFTYRILYIPETIGSIVYLSRHIDEMKKNTKAGFVLTCVGDDRTYSFLETRLGNTLSDRVAQCVLKHHYPNFKRYPFHENGSDERQYCSPGVDLPVASIMRSKYVTYPEYHTSYDNLDLVSPAGLGGAFEVYAECISVLESNCRCKVVFPCEPFLSKHALYPTCSVKQPEKDSLVLLNFIAYCDGEHDLIDISEKIDIAPELLIPIQRKLLECGVITRLKG